MRFNLILRQVRALLLGAALLVASTPLLYAQGPLDAPHEALLALDRYLETWNSRSPALWAASLHYLFAAWNSHDPQAVAAAIHYPHVRIADGQVEVWRTPQAILTGAEAGRQRTWYQTRVDKVTVVQTTANGVNLTVTISRLSRDGTVLSTDDGVFLVALRDGSWKVQARSMMGT